MNSLRLALICLWPLSTLAACSGQDDFAPLLEKVSCPANQSLWYSEAGCGPEIAPHCMGPPPPCADAFCSCSGQTIYSCGVTREPYRYKGVCAN
jgi:hypothetical protein